MGFWRARHYLVFMRNETAHDSMKWSRCWALLVLLVLPLLLAAPLAAGELRYGRPPFSQLSPVEQMMLRNIQRRESYQADQQRLREVDRRIVGAPLRQPRVPVVKPTCQTQVFGSRILRTCR